MNAGYKDSGSYNTFVGTDCGTATYTSGYSTGSSNTGVGYQALQGLNDGYDNVAIGASAHKRNQTGRRNTAIGTIAMFSDNGASGYNNVAVGYKSLYFLTTGDSNVGVGNTALQNITSGTDNVAIGQGAGLGNAEQSENVYIGYLAGYRNSKGAGVVHIGADAGAYTTGSRNVFVGQRAGQGGTGDSTPYASGEDNVALGYQALDDFTTGGNNTAIGRDALGSLTTSTKNVAIGNYALDSVAGTSYENIAIGYEAGKNGSNANFGLNIFIGTGAGKISSGDGGDSLYNVGIGNNTLTSLSGGDRNNCIGRAAGDSITTGARNQLLGYGTDVSAVNGQHQIVIGDELVGTANNRVHLGNSTSHIYNDYNTNATWTHSSDRRQKKDIKKDTLGLDFINDIEPVTYKHKSPSEFPKEWTSYDADKTEPIGGDKTIHGLIAQDVKEALDKQGVDTFGGWDETPDGRQHVSFEAFVLPLINSVKELSSENKELKDELNELKIFIKKKLGDE